MALEHLEEEGLLYSTWTSLPQQEKMDHEPPQHNDAKKACVAMPRYAFPSCFALLALLVFLLLLWTNSQNLVPTKIILPYYRR